jgi:hypothetical protein
MKSVNQQYRESGSDLSFRDWLNSQADQGVITKKIAPKEIQFNFIGDASVQFFGVDVKYLVIGALVITGGIIAYKKFKK